MRNNGFALVELLVAITIMGLLASAAVLTMVPSGAGARDSASRFAARVAAARDSAVMAGRPIGVWVSPSGYGFEHQASGQWQPLEAKPLASTDWGSGVRAELAGQGKVRFDNVGLPDRALDVVLVEDGRSATVRIAANGDVEVQ